MSPRTGIATLAIVVVVVVVIVVAGVGTYLLVINVPNTSGAKASTTLTIGTTISIAPTSSAQGYQYYQGTFAYTVPLGPSGINDSSGKPVIWNSTQTASGSFTFSINPSIYSGSGSGEGSITVTTRGYCTGTMTVQYTFTITAAHPPGENFTIGFSTPTPSSVMVQLTCQGPTTGFNQSNNPVMFLSEYPGLVSAASFPITVSQPLTDGISSSVTVSPVSSS